MTVGGGGVGWGEANNVPLHLQKSSCYGQEAGWGGVGWDNNVIGLAFSCTSTHTSCYAAVRSHALSHIRHATLTGFAAMLHMLVTCVSIPCLVRSHKILLR